MNTEEQLAKAERERDSFKRQLAMLQDAILLALVQRIEPRISRHPVTVVQHAGSVIARIGEAINCQFEDGDDLAAAVKELVRERDEAQARVIDAALIHAELVRERDEARAKMELFRHDFESRDRQWGEECLRGVSLERRLQEARAEVDRLRKDSDSAYRRGAEEMRLACQEWCRAWESNGEAIADALADLRAEDKP